MNKLTRILGVDNKPCRNSRTGSTISIIIPDNLILDVIQYYVDVSGNNEPTGRIKKIELIMYSEDDLKEVVEFFNTDELDKAITLEDVIIEQDEKTTSI